MCWVDRCVGCLVMNVHVLDVGDQCGCAGWLVINVDVLTKATNMNTTQMKTHV